MPHIHKQIVSDPPAPVEVITSHSQNVWETIGGFDQRVMSQFLADAAHFEEQYQPLNIWKFDNEVEFNPETHHNDYYVKVWYEAKGGSRLLYNF